MLSFFAADAPNGLQLAGDLNEVYWGTAAFIVLCAVGYKLAWPAIVKGFKARTERIEADLNAAQIAREEAEAELAAQTADLPDVSAEADRLVANANETAAKLKTDMVAKAHSDAAALKERAEADIASQRNQAMADLQSEVTQMTRGATDAVVTAQLDDSAQAGLIDRYIEQVRQLG